MVNDFARAPATTHFIFFNLRRMRMHNICIIGSEIGLPTDPRAGCAATCIREKTPNLRCSSGPLTAGELAGKEGNQHPQSIVRLDYSQQPYMPSSTIDTKPPTRPVSSNLTSRAWAWWRDYCDRMANMVKLVGVWAVEAPCAVG